MKRTIDTPIVLAVWLIFASLACKFGGLSTASTPIIPSPFVSPTLAIAETTTPPPPAGEVPVPTEAFQATPDQLLATATPAADSAVEAGRPSQPAGEYAVVLVGSGDVLNVRQAAGIGQPIVAELPPGETGISLTGKEQQVGNDRWVEISHPQAGRGWVNAFYLTEVVAPQDFCRDGRVNALLADLDRAITTADGDLLAALVSPVHGLYLRYFHSGNVANYTPEEARWVFQSDYVMDWGIHPASGLEVRGTFRAEVLPTLVEVFESDYTLQCNDPGTGGGNYMFSWPVEYAPINYYLIHKPGTPGVDLDWRTYLAGVEFVGGKPYLFALIHYFWEP